MSQVIDSHEVLTLEEAGNFLRISADKVEVLATRGSIPGRRVQGEWRFLKSAIEDWLRGPDYKQALLDQAGALRDDDSLSDVRQTIYIQRGRPEVSDSADG